MLKHLIPAYIADVIGHTLIYSVGVGILLAFMLAVLLVFTKRSVAAFRYNLLVGMLFAYVIAMLFILISSMFPFVTGLTVAGNVNQASGNRFYWVSFILKYTHEHSGFIVGIWLLVVVLQTIRLSFGIYTLERLKNVAISTLPAEWENRLRDFSQQLGIRRTVTLVASGIAKVPLVIGYFKPVILLPVGLVNFLEPEQVEAILLHELAHIRRMDYLVNALQILLETLFFFNPGLLWLSHLIRVERENCCDDIAIAFTKNRTGYLHALFHFEEYRLGITQPALAFSGQKTGIPGRFERLAGKTNRSLNKFELLSIGLLFFLSVFFIALAPSNPNISFVKPAARSRGGTSADTDQKAREAKKKAEEAFFKQSYKKDGP